MKQTQFATTKTVVTIGNFDGLHKGHLQLINKAKEIATKKHLKSLVCNFDCNTKGAAMISSKNQLIENLNKLKLDYMVTLNFLDEIIQLDCESFAKKYLQNRFQASVVVVGENFRFGKKQSGDIHTLKELGEKYGFTVISVKMVFAGRYPLSSTRIRRWIKDGKIELANRYLFEPFSAIEEVSNGYHVGNTQLSYPTANLPIPENLIVPPFGVYQTYTVVDNETYQSITNIGYAPTLKKQTPVIETHLLDFTGDLYGKRIKVIFKKYIRKERKFKDLDSLKAQIIKDIAKCNFQDK